MAFAVNAPAQTLTASATPNTVTFTYQIGAATLPVVQKVSLRASTGTPTYLVLPGAAAWVTATSTSTLTPPVTPDTLLIRVNPTGLPVGTYATTISLAVTGVASDVAITVNLAVTPPPPVLTLSSISLTFVSPPNPPSTQAISLSTTGAPVSFTATVSGAPWLTISPSTGVVLSPGEAVQLTVTVDASALAPQAKAYTGKIAITSSAANKTQNITVNLTVNSSPPTITSLWPSTIQTNTGAATITIRGSNFYAATTVAAGTTPLTFILLSPTAIQAVVPATLLTAAGSLNITATNPAPGGASMPSALTVSSAPVVQAVLNAASYVGSSVSPGELVSLFGLGIGPSAPVFMSTAARPGFVDTNIGGLTVTFDGVAAPLLYADPNQITVQVPYEATLGTAKAVVVTNGTASPSTTTVTIAATAPAFSAPTPPASVKPPSSSIAPPPDRPR